MAKVRELVSDLELGVSGDLRPSENETAEPVIPEVPDHLRKVNPKAYTPQMVAIGRLQNRFKFRETEGIKSDMLNSFKNIYGIDKFQNFKEIVEKDEQFIRDSYPLSFAHIANISMNFEEMILKDSVFILLFFIQTGSTQNFSKKDDILHELPSTLQENAAIIKEDLMLLENQLPYALLEKLFEPFFSNLDTTETFRDITLRTFGFKGKIKDDVKFLHFTDLFWHARVSTLSLTEEQISIAKTEQPKKRKIMYNAEKLYSAGVDFKNVDEGNDLSLVITFENGILKLPCFTADEHTERELRNLLAFEMTHSRTPYVRDYISFLEFLINNEQDVDLLVRKGIVKNGLGDNGSVTQMLKNLHSGLAESQYQYYDVVERVNKYYENYTNRTVGTLKRVYFKDVWTGTATITAVVLLVMTLIHTVTSILQLMRTEQQ